MKYNDYTFDSPSLIKRIAHKKRLKMAFQLLDLKVDDGFIDFGGGDGAFAEFVASHMPNIKISIYEPSKTMSEQIKKRSLLREAKVITEEENLPFDKLNKISCLEVLEHLNQNELNRTLELLQAILKTNGIMVVSVPIEIGLSSLVKNIFRLIRNPGNDRLTALKILKSFWGSSQKRDPEHKFDHLNYIYTHIGFDYRNFKKLLNKYFFIEKQFCSPFHFLKTFLNHTVYFICSKKPKLCKI